LEGFARNGDNGNEPGRLYANSIGSTPASLQPGYWENFEILKFRDGKSRRVESGAFPLVNGIPAGVVSGGNPSTSEDQATAEARVMRLKGYGNAIVPELAAEFIKSAMDAIAQLQGELK
jgi:DNA (cytosine-5)-methyltransferase 1